MTARVCPVHGEYAADGRCRWCEPKTLLDVALSGPKVRPLPVAEPTPWASKPPTYMGAPVVLDPHSDRDGPVFVDWTLGPEVDTPEKLARIANVDEAPPLDGKAVRKAMDAAWLRLNTYGCATVFFPSERDAPFIDAETHAAEESRLLAQHAALRWERVARRWATKAKFDGHERTVDGTLAFDDRCSECRRTRRLTDAGIPKEWP